MSNAPRPVRLFLKSLKNLKKLVILTLSMPKGQRSRRTCISPLLLPVLLRTLRRLVILSEAFDSPIVKRAVEGPAFIIAVACPFHTHPKIVILSEAQRSRRTCGSFPRNMTTVTSLC
jgi:hypothetical protein